MHQCTPYHWLYFDRCEDFGLTEIKPGTNSLDTEYGKTPPVALIIGALLGLTAVVAVAGALFFIKRCRTCPPRGKFHIDLNIDFIWPLNV